MQSKKNAQLLNLFKKIETKFQPKKPDYKKERQLVGNIIIAVLTERIDVRRALLLFPKGSKDPSVCAAWHALCHYEADEDIKKNDLDYVNQQQEYLELIAYTFKDGNELPQNIISAYQPFYHDNPISYEDGLKGIITKLLRFINL